MHRLDVLIDDTTFGKARHSDVPFNAQSGELAVVPSTAMLRAMKENTQHLRLVAVGENGERLIGHYAFNHAPFQSG